MSSQSMRVDLDAISLTITQKAGRVIQAGEEVVSRIHIKNPQQMEFEKADETDGKGAPQTPVKGPKISISPEKRQLANRGKKRKIDWLMHERQRSVAYTRSVKEEINHLLEHLLEIHTELLEISHTKFRFNENHWELLGGAREMLDSLLKTVQDLRTV